MNTLIRAAALIAVSTGAAIADDVASAAPHLGDATPFDLAPAGAPLAPVTIQDYVLAQQGSPHHGVVVISTAAPVDFAIDTAARQL
ncbi:MAG: hypothetical protein AAGA68_17640 [Pseudomonadota bacterium]